jgi:hypothetical protein
MNGEFKYDTPVWNMENEEEELMTSGAPISDIEDNGDSGFEFHYNGYEYDCSEPIYDCVLLEGDRVKETAVEEASEEAYKPNPNMKPLTRKHLLL